MVADLAYVDNSRSSSESYVCLLLQGKKISCPTCRAGTRVADVAYVDNGRSAMRGDQEAGGSSAVQEAAIPVEGSYGTKVSPDHLFIQSTCTCMLCQTRVVAPHGVCPLLSLFLLCCTRDVKCPACNRINEDCSGAACQFA